MGAARFQNESKRNLWVDLFKIVAAFFVVGIHCASSFGFDRGDQPVSILNASLFRVAVPFFLFVSAYFVSKKGQPIAYLKLSLRYAILYLVWTVIYLPIIVYQQFVPLAPAYHEGILPFIQRFLCSGSVTILWYLLGCSVGFALSGLARYLRIPMAIRLAISFAFFLVGAYGDSYYGILGAGLQSVYNAYFQWGQTTLNGLFFCWFFIELAAAFERLWSTHVATKPKLISCLVVLLLSIGMLALESCLLCLFSMPRDMNFLFSTFLVVPSLFALCLVLPSIGVKLPISLGAISSFVYLLQLYGLALYKIVFSNVAFMQNSIIKWIVVSILLLLAAALLSWLVGKIKKPWVKWLY